MRVVRHWNRSPRTAVNTIPGSVQGQVGWGLEQHVLVEDVPTHGREVGTR